MRKIKYSLLFFIVAYTFLSCSKSKSFDITGDPEVKFFTNITAPGNAPQNSINFSVVNIPNTAGSGLVNLSNTLPATIQFPALASKPISLAVTIGAVLDTTLIAAYNAAHNTNYVSFPAGVLKTDALFTHMSQGATMSSDSFTIATDPTNLNLMSGQAYMAPIKLSTLSSSTVGKITDNMTTQVVYIVANVEQRRIKYLATTADVQGTLISPRTPWTVTFTPTVSTVGSIIDGSTTTYSRWTTPVTPYGQVDVNMQAAKNVTGIRLYTSNSATYIPTQVDVYLSNDGINYDYIGSPLKANLTYATSYNYILFYKTIPAQFIRLRLYYSTSTSTNNGRVTELDVYAN